MHPTVTKEEDIRLATPILLGLVDCVYAYDGNVCRQNFQRKNN